ncbi:type II secretion system protein GspD [Marinicauda salina]|uniref:Type II secretion system protein GspD n=1 Tax=Marinicauda salina TaxID=2135793 RepID=A0A2U2BXI6_9PROT|nr:type II secretion system secretin GspD [Marinicauda salina]PWE18725.1 type II secretion system protein GspD [Marinicauda salina]
MTGSVMARIASAALAALCLQACETFAPDAGGDEPARSPEPAAEPAPDPDPQALDFSVPSSEPAERDEERLVYFRDMAGASALDSDGLSERDFRTGTLGLDFVDAPVADVARAVVSEALGEQVAVASGVDGRITLTAPEPAPVRSALRALEAVLAESGLALVELEEGFLLTTRDRAGSAGGVAAPRLGFGARIVPVTNTTPTELLPLIDPFITDQVEIAFDDAEGIIILTGPGPDVESARSAIELFDRPYLVDRVFGMFELHYIDARTAKSEIDTLLQGMGLSPETVRTLALPRLNLLFVATRERARFDEIEGWIDRFDRPSGGDERRLRYYVGRNTPAETLARQISAAFAGSGAGTGQSGELPRFSGDDAATSDEAGQDDEPGGRLTIIPDELNNGLIIRATDQEYREIVQLLERMDVMPPQVLIEATIAEVRLTDELSFGVRWFFEEQVGEGDHQLNFTDSPTGSFGPAFPGFNYAFVGSDINAALSALDSVTDVSVLSAPSIMVQNNQTANLQVGDEVPIVTQTAQAVSDPNAPLVQNVTLRETGVILEVSPRINASGMVVLDVTQEVSSARPSTTSGIDSPTIQQLRFTSTVAVRSRNTIALGGLIREQATELDDAVPLLGRIPGIGNAFRSRTERTERREVVIFLTPRIISTEAEVDEALQRIRRELGALEDRYPDLFEE